METSQTEMTTSLVNEPDPHVRSGGGPDEVVACVIAVIVLLGVVLTIALYYSFWPTMKEGTVPPARSYSEDSIVRRLKAIMAPGEDPCRDFYSFVCGNYRSQSGNTLLEMENYMYKSLLRELNAAVPGRNQSAAGKAAALYKVCADADVDEATALRDFIAHVGLSWPEYKGAAALDKILMLFFRHNVITLLSLKLEDNRLSRNKRELYITVSDAWVRWSKQRGQGATFVVYMETLGLPVRDITDAENQAFGRLSQHVLDRLKRMSFMTLSRLERLTPSVVGEGWAKIVETHTDGVYSGSDEVQVSQPAMEYLNKLYAEIGNERLSLLTAWELVRTLSPFTVPAVAHRHKKQSLQELCLDAVRNAMEVPLLSWYLFPEVTSASVGMALNMATHIKATTLELIRRSPWLDGATKNAALHKLYAMTLHVGYPRYFNSTRAIDRTYRQYPDIAGSFFKPWLEAMNMTITWITTNHSSIRYSLVHTNAAFWHMRNMIVVPATILRNPMFSRTAPPAYNCGGLGHVMTHEMMHGFDRSGSRWDAHGEFRNWWSPDSRIKYEERISCLRRSHNASNANEDTENTADFAGLVSAYNAFLELVDKEQLKQYAELNYGAEQLFFIAACVKYCSQSKNQSFSGYASWQNRCNVPIRNLDAFGEAFNCPVGSYMRPKPADRCAFW